MKDEKVFGRVGLNLDDDPRYFGVNDTDLIQNMLPNVTGDAGVEETYLGNIEVPSAFVYSGGVKVVGTCRDAKTSYIYIFVKADDPLDGNSLLQYDPISETYRKIVFEDVNLVMGDHVYGAVVFGDYIIYNTLTDGLRKVHIDYANRYYNIDLWDIWLSGAYNDGDLVRRPDGSCYVCIQDTILGVGLPEAEPTYWSFEYYTYPSITETTFVLRNMPPVDRPTITYATDASKYINNLLKKTFQFAYRYKYVDGGNSVYSEYSDIAMPPHLENWDGNLIFGLYDNNKIVIGFTRGERSIVEYVEVIVREGNDGTWRLFKTITEDVSSIDFFNDESYEAVDQDEVLMAEDAVPRSCADMSLINENRIVMARLTEGFDSVDVDASMWPVAEAVDILSAADIAIQTLPIAMFYNDSVPESDPDYGKFMVSAVGTSALAGYAEDDLLKIDIVYFVPGSGLASIQDTYVITAADVATFATFIAHIDALLTSLLGSVVGEVNTVDIDHTYDANNTLHQTVYDIELYARSPGDPAYIYGQLSLIDHTVVTSLNKWNTYKSGASHQHGIEYFDAEFRHSTVQTNIGLDVAVRERGFYMSGLSNRIKLNWTIAHLAPSWARYWRWVYSGNKTQSSFVQYVIASAATGSSPYDNFIGFDISPLQLLKTNDPSIDISFLGSIIDPYVFTEGDRVRILTGAESGAVLGDVLIANDFYDIPVAAFDAAAHMLYVPKPASGSYGAGAGSLIEIYSPRSFEENAEPYFPVGPIYPVLTGGYHSAKQRATVAITGVANNGFSYARITTATPHGLTQGDWVRIAGTTNYNGDLQAGLIVDATRFDIGRTYTSSQTGTASPLASGTLESGDAWLIGRAFSDKVGTSVGGTLFPVESMHYSDFYLSDVWDKGKPAIQSTIGEVTQNNIRWGLKHLTGASVDGMFTFDALDYKSTTEIYGDLERIGECGDILRLIFNKKVASMYIGKAEFLDTEGSSVIATSNNVLSNPNYSIDDFGTTVPEAVLFVKGTVYFIDLHNGAIVRSTNNGSYPISGKTEASEDSPQYKMSSYFRDICNQVLDAQMAIQSGTTLGGDMRMLLGWDNGRKLLYVSILQENIESRTLAFSEDRGRWLAALDFKNVASGYFPTAYEWASGKFLSFLDGSDSVWDHCAPSCTPLSIYGEAKIATISVWSVVHPNKTKVFDSIILHTDVSEWYGSVYIPASLSYPNGMESRLFATNFVRRENALYSAYLFNGLSRGPTFSMLGLYNGESLRGYSINNRLSIATAAKLFKVDINYRISNV